MYNWSTDEEELKKHPKEYQKWRLLQLINYGLDGEKIDLVVLKKYWAKIKPEILDNVKIKYFEKYIFQDEKHSKRPSK